MKNCDIATIILLWLTLLLVALKLTACPELNWGWVFAPIWIPCAFGILVIAGVIYYGTKGKKK